MAMTWTGLRVRHVIAHADWILEQETRMLQRTCLVAVAAIAMLCASATNAPAVDDVSKYPDWSGKWRRAEGGPPRYDPSKPRGAGQQPPLTPEYQKIFEASLAAQAAGGQGNDTTYTCIPVGMPRQATSGFPIEMVVTPRTTYWLYEASFSTTRRVFTDGRSFPSNEEPTFAGYSIGQWLDTDNDGKFDTLVVETRNLKGPRQFDNSGAPLHDDNATVIKERMFADKSKPDSLFNEVTTIDNALTRPWTVMKNYLRVKNPTFAEDNCSENNNHVEIGKEGYFLSADGYLMPTRKNQPPPELRYFPQAAK
jgi:hypothetical protein